MYDILPMTVFGPLIAGFVLLFVPRKIAFLPKALALIMSVLTFGLAVRIFRIGDNAYMLPLFQIGSLNLELVLKVDPLRGFILLFAMGFGLLITLYSLKSMASVKQPNLYYGAILLTIGGTAGVLLANHLLLLLIFWEIVTAALYLLITTGGKNSNFAATKSFAMIGASDAAFLLGIAIVWVLSRRTFIISLIALETTSALPIIAFLLLVTAAITKAGALPLHTWLPASGEYAPTSVMALLPAAIDKLLGIYLLVIVVREIFILNSAALSLVLAIIGAATIIIGAMMAIVQRNIKKLLAYSAISQVGYMVLGIATGTAVGLAGAVFHMLNNAIYKCCLFLSAGSVEHATGTVDMDRLGGIGKKMPLTFAAFLIAALSVSGIPPLNGFVSKWMVYQGLIQMGTEQSGGAAGIWPILLIAAIFGGALTLAYSVKIIHSVFLSRAPSQLEDVKEVSATMMVPGIILAALCVLLGIFYKQVLAWLIYPALNIEPGTAIFGTWRSGVAFILIAVTIAIGLIIWFVGKLSKNIRIVPTWTCGEVQDNEQMIIPGTHFYKTVSSMGGLKQLYTGAERGYFDLYNQGSRLGWVVTGLLRALHIGVLPMYLTWVTLGLLIVVFVICGIS